MRQLVYDPVRCGEKLTIVCFVSGSGTNYREIVKRNNNHNYTVFTNRPGCGGTAIARENNHQVIVLSHIPYLKAARGKYSQGKIPRNCPERQNFDQQVSQLIESAIGREPDLICLAGYDQWLSDWMVDRYYPRILNIHPGDTTKGYDGLYWIPSAKAILAGDEAVRSTLFFVDKGEDTGPVLVQSRPLYIASTIAEREAKGAMELSTTLGNIISFAKTNSINTYQAFEEKAGQELKTMMEQICLSLQDSLKIAGDWEIYPFGIHSLIAAGRVAIADRTVYIDDQKMPVYGYRMGAAL